MADAAVDSLLDNLHQLLIHHGKLIEDALRQVEQLEENVSFFKSFLKKVSNSKQRKDETLKALVRDIHDVVYDAEDTINALVTQAAENKTKSYFVRHFNSSTNIISVADKVDTICCRISQIYGSKVSFDLANLPATDADDEEHLQPPSLRRDNVVGLKDEAETIVGYLNAKTDYLDVISIIGMCGLGKTTLTGKIFHDPKVTCEFPIRIWVYVSQEFIPKKVFLAILRQMNTKLNEDEYSKKNASQLAEEISLYLEGEKFLLVLDDVWEPIDNWDRLKPALPKRNTAGKIMITSRQEGVGKYANRFREPHNLRYLNQEESVELLQWEVFGKPEFPPELDGAGREIARNCYGLPLAIVVIGGLLNTKISASSTEWEKVSESVTTFLEPPYHMNIYNVISMSYENLPYHLKECFLYFGMFPEDLEIPVWNLIQMWIAEGLIQPKNDLSMEEIAEYYLDDLINKNLVMALKVRADGRVKTCRIHDMLRDFCKIESGKYREFFLQEIRQSSNGVFEPLVTERERHRRLCIHSNVLDFLKSCPKGVFVRSFVTFSEDLDIPAENISDIYEGFKLLRVLEAKPLKFSKIPRDFYHLVHLKYLTLSLKFDYNLDAAILPQAFSKLWNIETLIVHTTFRKLEIRADIMQMTRLRHLKTDACATLVEPGTESREGERLQTLSTVSPESCTEAVLDRACNLKKLSIRGKIAQFLDGKIGSFECLRKLGYLEKLKLLNDLFPKPANDGKLDRLPPAYKFPEQLRSLTLFNTFLDWSHMSVLGSLEKLQALKLKDNAFVGMRWEVIEYSFISLEVLHIGRTNLSIWVASANHFPSLKRLQLHNCDKLEEIPTDLANITALKHMDLLCCQRAAASATKIAEIKNDRLFHLTVFPPTS